MVILVLKFSPADVRNLRVFLLILVCCLGFDGGGFIEFLVKLVVAAGFEALVVVLALPLAGLAVLLGLEDIGLFPLVLAVDVVPLLLPLFESLLLVLVLGIVVPLLPVVVGAGVSAGSSGAGGE
jgi:hypothetical protein